MDSSKEDVVSNRLGFLLEYEDEILSVGDQIDNCLHENLKEIKEAPQEAHLLNSISLPLSQTVQDQDILDSLAVEISNAILRWDGEYTRVSKELETQKRFTKLFTRLTSKYQLNVTHIKIIEEEGSNFWRRADTDIVSRPPNDTLGMTHHISIGLEGETVQLTTSMDSNLRIIDYLLDQQVRLAANVDEEIVDEMSKERLESIRNTLQQLEEARE